MSRNRGRCNWYQAMAIVFYNHNVEWFDDMDFVNERIDWILESGMSAKEFCRRDGFYDYPNRDYWERWFGDGKG